jgi:hypothetical protein
MKRLGYVASMAMVALGLALAPAAAMAAGHGGGGFGGHVGGFGGHIGGFGGEHGLGAEPAFGGHTFDAGHFAAGRGFDGGGHVGLGDGFAGGRHDPGDGIALGARAFSGGNHLMYGRVPRFGRGGVFLGYTYPSPGVCYQYPEYYNPAVGCYGLEPIG